MNDGNDGRRLVTRKEAAAMLGLRPQTLAKWAHLNRSDLKMVKLGSSVRYRVADLEKFIDRNST